MAEERKTPKKLLAKDITFQEMSENEAVKTFVEDGYTEYKKRKIRYGSNLPANSIWATNPATMFVAFYENTPVGVVGFSEFKGVLLSAGIHLRKEFRGRGIVGILVDKMIKEKGSKTLFANITNPRASAIYRSKGFKDMNKEELPQEIQDELEGVDGYVDQLQKFLIHTPHWFSILRV